MADLGISLTTGARGTSARERQQQERNYATISLSDNTHMVCILLANISTTTPSIYSLLLCDRCHTSALPSQERKSHKQLYRSDDNGACVQEMKRSDHKAYRR